MVQTEHGTMFIGFSGAMQCEKCGNASRMHLRQEYFGTKVLFAGHASYGQVLRVCSVCEHTVFAGRPKAWPRKGELAELHTLLGEGRDHTKAWIRSLPEKQMDKVLERYYSLEAFDLMRYVLE